MPTLLTAHNHRLAFLFGQDRDEWLSGSCGATGLQIPSGVSVQFQIGVYEDLDAGTFYDLSDIASMRAEIKKMRAGDIRPRPEDPTYADEPITTLDAATITASGWADGTEQHATFAFQPSETALDPGGYWLAFSGFSAGGNFVAFGWGRIDFVQDGTGIVTPVEPLSPSYYTAAQVDDLIAAALGQVPGQTLTLNGEALTLNGEELTLNIQLQTLTLNGEALTLNGEELQLAA